MKHLITYLLLLFIIIFIGCEKTPTFPDEQGKDVAGEPIVSENAIVVDSLSGSLLSDSIQLANGVYVFESLSGINNLKENSILVGVENGGYLRKVSSIDSSGAHPMVYTEQAALEELFGNAAMEFNFNLSQQKSTGINSMEYKGTTINYLAEGIAINEEGFLFSFSNTPLYEDELLSISISSGEVKFVPNFDFNLIFEDFNLQMLELKTEKTQLSYNCDLLFHGNGSVSLLDKSKKLTDVTWNFVFWVGWVPVVVSVNTKLVARFTTDLSAAYQVDAGFSGDFSFDLSAGYKQGEWFGDYAITPGFDLKPVKIEGTANLDQKLIITPETSITFYKVATAALIPELQEEFNANLAYPSLDWDAELSTNFNTTISLSADIFKKNLGKYEKSYPLEGMGWNAPDKIELVSGNNQPGEQGKQLPNPVKVKVVDNYGNAIPKVPVYFDVDKGGGTLDNESIVSDDQGMAEVFWTLGNEGEDQEISVRVLKPDKSHIAGSPLKIVANAEQPEFKYEGTWMLKWITETGEMIEDDKIVFGSDGISTSYESFSYGGIPPNTEWVSIPETWQMTYANGEITLVNLNWSNIQFKYFASDPTANIYYDQPASRIWAVTELHRL